VVRAEIIPDTDPLDVAASLDMAASRSQPPACAKPGLPSGEGRPDVIPDLGIVLDGDEKEDRRRRSA
jgi:hypothetical protein